MKGVRPPWAARVIHAVLVSTYPRRIRSRFGVEMRQLFVDSYAEIRAAKHAQSIISFYLSSFCDVLINSIQARFERTNRTTDQTATREGVVVGKASFV